MDPGRRRKVRLAAMLSVAVLLASALVYTTFAAGSQAVRPSQLARSAVPGRSYQLSGTVVAGSVRRTGGPPANGALEGHAFLWAITLNSVGTLFLIGVSLLSIARRQRVRANVWIASGAIVIAASTGLSRADYTSLVYVGELIGIALMFCGFTLAGQRARRPPRLTPARANRPAAGAITPRPAGPGG